jgi:hypothetical protein
VLTALPNNYSGRLAGTVQQQGASDQRAATTRSSSSQRMYQQLNEHQRRVRTATELTVMRAEIVVVRWWFGRFRTNLLAAAMPHQLRYEYYQRSNTVGAIAPSEKKLRATHER